MDVAPRSRTESPKPPSFDGALCVGSDAGDWDDVETKGTSRLPGRTIIAMEICMACPVAKACLKYAMDSGATGVWGGRLFHDVRYLGSTKRAVSA